MKKKENESVKEFDTRYENLIKQIPNDIFPKDGVVLLQYTNAFEGKFGFMLRDKSPKTLVEAQEYADEIEQNLLASKVEPFHAPHSKAETKPRALNNANSKPIQDPMTLFAQRHHQMTTEFLQTHNLPMNEVTNLERAQRQSLPPKPQYNNNRQQRGNQGWKPRPPNDQRVPNILAPTDMINQEIIPWCLPCGDSHWEYECSRLHNKDNNNNDPNNCERMNYIERLDPTYTISSQRFYNITL